MADARGEGGVAIEKRQRTETIVGWAVVIFLVGIMFLRVFIAMGTVGDRPRPYNYRTAPLIPAESYASTMPSAATTVNAPSQVVLPPPSVGRKAAGTGQQAPSAAQPGKAPTSSMPAPAEGPR